jgi:hypothetical protein
MGKIIRRTVTITITETWTIIWTDAPEAMAASRDTEQGEAVACTHLAEQLPPEGARPKTAIPGGELAVSLPDGVPSTDAPGDGEKQAALTQDGTVI